MSWKGLGVEGSKLASQVAGFVRTIVRDGLLDAVCPRACLLCRTLEVAEAEEFCEACYQAFSASVGQPYCRRCGRTVPPYGARPEGCGNCAGQKLPYDQVIRVGSYTGALAALLRSFKYAGREELDDFFARRLARRLAQSDVYEDVDAVVAVPTCWQHRLRRPFHPAVVIARRAARRCAVPYADVLRRVGGGPHQVGMSLTARLENVRGKFRLARGCAAGGARLCLVDDVMTTGATAGECSRVLKKAGAAAVYVAVLARAGDDPLTLRHV